MEDINLEAELKTEKLKKEKVKNNQGLPAQSAGITRIADGEDLVQIGPRLPKILVRKLNLYAEIEQRSSQDVVQEALEKFFARKNVPGFD